MGHAIHKHMHGSSMKSAEKYDAKEAYNKDLTSKARLHYLENNIADKKGSPARMDDSYADSPTEFNKGLKDASAAGKLDDNPNFKAKVDASMSRKSSPANNIPYGDISGKTGYMGGMSRMDVNPAEAVMTGAKDTREGANGGMSRYKKDHKGMSRGTYGGNKGDESKSKRDY